MNSEEKIDYLSDTAPDILQKISLELNSIDVAHLNMTSRSINTALTAPILWKHMLYRDFNITVPIKFEEQAYKFYQALYLAQKKVILFQNAAGFLAYNSYRIKEEQIIQEVFQNFNNDTIKWFALLKIDFPNHPQATDIDNHNAETLHNLYDTLLNERLDFIQNISIEDKFLHVFRQNDIEPFNNLLIRAINLNIKIRDNINNTGFNILMRASYFGHEDTVKLLIEAGANPQLFHEISGKNALMLAIENGNINCVATLVSVCDVNYAISSFKINNDNRGNTALFHNTAKLKHFPKKSSRPLLIAQIINQGYTALMFAAKHGAIDAAKILLQAGANKNLTELEGKTASTIAKDNGHHEIADYIDNYDNSTKLEALSTSKTFISSSPKNNSGNENLNTSGNSSELTPDKRNSF